MTQATAELLTGRHHPATSLAAASRARLSRIAQHERIEAYVLSCGKDGATSDEISLALDIKPHSLSARLLELRGEEKNNPMDPVLVIAKQNGKDLTRLTESGCPARVHIHFLFAGKMGQLDLFEAGR